MITPKDGAYSNQGNAIKRWFQLRRLRQELLGRFGVLSGLLLMMAGFSALSPVFLTAGNLQNILIQSGTNAMIAAGMTFVILSGEIDLSVGSILAFSSVLGASLMAGGQSVATGIAAMLAIATLVGVFNGFLVAFLGFPAFIVTLASMWLFRGASYVVTEGQAITNLPEAFRLVASGSVFGIPNIVILMLLVYAICHVVLSQTTFGRQIYAVGDNQESARLSGVRVCVIKLSVFAISGFMAGLGGVILSSRLFSGQPVAGITFELSAIAAVVIGGTSLSAGGIGGVPGTLVGAVFIATLLNGLVILNVTAFWQQLLMGVVVLAAVAIDKYRKQFS